jgi:hypothetical protein
MPSGSHGAITKSILCVAGGDSGRTTRKDLSCQIPADPERYLTAFFSPHVAKHFIFEGDILSACQKPVSVKRRVLTMRPPIVQNGGDEGV